MDKVYIEYQFTIEPKESATEILIAELGNAGFESFVETQNGVIAYIQKDEWFTGILNDIYILSSTEFTINYQQKEVAQTNWNAEWEKNFSPIIVDNTVSVRAPFHENPNVEFDIVIEPKMSFGTGHHETTHMMIQHLLQLDLKNKRVLDMGCGTGILAIFAEMKGATQLDAIDIDNWCYLNSIENAERNNCSHINVYEGDALLLEHQTYDVIIANINRNILLNDMPRYVNCLAENGILLLSGFYKEDIAAINEKVTSYQLKLESEIEKNNWIALRYKKH
ncbi:MAG: 50S ribosomal protein L11 methyltransferase [Flavobacteriaceae bacterium]|nr:50S ribosomal protein L11 methyltransferase [Flavobacteriaceae bacterium]